MAMLLTLLQNTVIQDFYKFSYQGLACKLMVIPLIKAVTQR